MTAPEAPTEATPAPQPQPAAAPTRAAGTRPASVRTRVPVGPVLLAAGLAVAAVGLILVDQLGPVVGLAWLAGGVLLAVALWRGGRWLWRAVSTGQWRGRGGARRGGMGWPGRARSTGGGGAGGAAGGTRRGGRLARLLGGGGTRGGARAGGATGRRAGTPGTAGGGRGGGPLGRLRRSAGAGGGGGATRRSPSGGPGGTRPGARRGGTGLGAALASTARGMRTANNWIERRRRAAERTREQDRRREAAEAKKAAEPAAEPATQTDQPKPRRRPSPGPTPTGGPMTQPGRHTEDASLYRWGQALQHTPGAIEELAVAMEELARQAEDEQPVAGSVSQSIRDVAIMLRRAAEEAGGWHAGFRRDNEADIERTENPRKGSAHIEARADVGRAMRDQ